MKGGVGKTTLTANLAGALARYHEKKILIVDVDMQANLSQYFMSPLSYANWIKKEGTFKNKQTVLSIYQKRNLVNPSSVKKKGITATSPSLKNLTHRVYEYGEAHVDLIPSTIELVDLDYTNAENRLKIFLKTINNKYDFILIDCPPTMYFFTKSALIASDSYLIPVKPDHLSSLGFMLLEKVISQLEADTEKNLNQIGTVFTMVKNTTLMKDTMRNMKQLPNRYFFDNYLGDYTGIAEAACGNKLIFEYKRSSDQIKSLQNITDEFIQRISDIEND
jgi:chromosome partitioning protein